MIPRIVAHLICKNEEVDLPRCLNSIATIVSCVVIADTGSTDDTERVAKEECMVLGLPLFYGSFLGANDKNGLLADFSKARNAALQWTSRYDPEWLLWMDADDELMTIERLHTLPYDDYDMFGLSIDIGEVKQIHHRLWRAGKGIHFEGPVHEYPTMVPRAIDFPEIVIKHHWSQGSGESSLDRNLRILLHAWHNGDKSARTAFYLAQTHHHRGDYTNAVRMYEQRIALGYSYLDEYLFAYLYLARCQRLLGNLNSAEYTLLTAVSKHKDWAEFWWELADIAKTQGRKEEAIGYAMQAKNKKPIATNLWREHDKYGPAAVKLIEECQAPAIITKGHLPRALVRESKNVICLRRPGAIGDILMTLNLIPLLKQANPESEIWYFTDPKYAAEDQLGWIIRAAGADIVWNTDLWDHTTGVRKIDLIGHLQPGFPYVPLERHVIRQFAIEMGLTLGEELPALTLARPQRRSKMYRDEPYITWQSRAGWSKYKMWDQERWHELREALGPEFNCINIDNVNEWPLSATIACFANARMHIGIDSMCNHLSWFNWSDDNGNSRKVNSVVLWGSTQVSGTGYPTNVNISKGLHCQPCFRDNPDLPGGRGEPCINPPRASYHDDTPWACMDQITVEEVVEAVRAKWKECK